MMKHRAAFLSILFAIGVTILFLSTKGCEQDSVDTPSQKPLSSQGVISHPASRAPSSSVATSSQAGSTNVETKPLMKVELAELGTDKELTDTAVVTSIDTYYLDKQILYSYVMKTDTQGLILKHFVSYESVLKYGVGSKFKLKLVGYTDSKGAVAYGVESIVPVSG